MRRCLQGGALAPHKLLLPPSLVCPFATTRDDPCSPEPFAQLSDLYQHIREAHLPKPLPEPRHVAHRLRLDLVAHADDVLQEHVGLLPRQHEGGARGGQEGGGDKST